MPYTCPHCQNPIYDDDALLCLYCGDSLRRGVGVMGKIKYPTPRAIIVVAAAGLILWLILLWSR
ncbi:MAG: hypothetical protein ACE5GG_04840 [Candidatus Omnitrophota bacterium]